MELLGLTVVLFNFDEPSGHFLHQLHHFTSCWLSISGSISPHPHRLWPLSGRDSSCLWEGAGVVFQHDLICFSSLIGDCLFTGWWLFVPSLYNDCLSCSPIFKRVVYPFVKFYGLLPGPTFKVSQGWMGVGTQDIW